MFSRIAPGLRWGALCVSFILCGCKAVGPDYKTPKLSETELPPRWTSPTGNIAATTPQAPATQWWVELADPALNSLVTEAFSNSPTLEAALARLNESRAAHAQASGAALPVLGGNAAGQRADSVPDSAPSNSGWLSLNSSWELDLFGAVRRGSEGAAAHASMRNKTCSACRKNDCKPGSPRTAQPVVQPTTPPSPPPQANLHESCCPWF